MALRDVAVQAMQVAPWLETVATALHLPEKSISEQAAGWQPTKYTRGGPLQVWAAENFDVAPGSREQDVAVQQAKDAGTFYKTTTPITTTDGGGGDTGGSGDDWGRIYQTYYQGWNEEAARQDFYNTRRGNEGTFGPTGQTGPSPEELERQRYEQEARGAIESAYSDYFNQLDTMLNEGLSAQQAAQRGIAESQYTQGVASLGSQREEGMGLLGRQREVATENQARNLRDIAANLKNSFMAGNVYLGAMGAGDSSAANQYAYALTKLGTRQRGDIMKQTADIQREIDDREAKLQNIYTEEVNRLASERDQKIMGVAQWFAEAQNQIRQAQAQGRLQKGQDLASLSQNLLNNAINNLNAVKQEEANRRAALEQWALSNAQNIQQVRANMGAIYQGYNPRLPQAPRGIVGTPQVGAGGNMTVPGYYSNYQQNEEEENSLFSNPAWR